MPNRTDPFLDYVKLGPNSCKRQPCRLRNPVDTALCAVHNAQLRIIRTPRGGVATTFMRLLPLFAANRLDDLAYHVNNKLRLLLVYLVAAIRVGNVLCVGHKLGEAFLRLFLRRIGDVPKVYWNIFW